VVAAHVEQAATPASRASAARLRIALVGCGAVAERLHLPALARVPGVRVSALVDPDPDRLAVLATRAGARVHAARDITDLDHHADAAIVAAPTALHADLAVALLERGLHVLVEKPAAVSLNQARALVEAADRSGRKLAVGLLRRYYPSYACAREVLRAGWLGRIRAFDLREGVVNAWPARTLAFFQRAHGGGVLLDAGAHALDWVLALLGPFAHVRYADDGRGGVEANCLIELELRDGARGVVELSRNRELRNSLILTGERGELEIGLTPDAPVVLRAGGTRVAGYASGQRQDGAGAGIAEAARRQIESFRRCIVDDAPAPVPARAALEPARLFDACRSVRQPLALPWEPYEAEVDWAAFADKRVFVLGGAGFIGARVVQALAQKSAARIRLLARSYAGVGEVARYPVELVRGDIGDEPVLAGALAGCDYVINCTYGKGDLREQRRVNVDAVRRLVELAARQGVRQVVHTSTVLVYGSAPDGALDERAPARPNRRDPYAWTKWRGEAAALATGARLGVPVAVVQPAAVYGPGAPSWTVRPIHAMKAGRLVLVDGGAGISNAVYVDDVVAALLRAAISPGAGGDRLLVGGGDVVTWREFFGAYDALLGGGRLLALDATQIAQARRRRRRETGTLAQLRALVREEQRARRRLLALPPVAAVRPLARALVPARLARAVRARLQPPAPAVSGATAAPLWLPDPDEERFYRARVRVDWSKAATLIGYRPRYDLAGGMERVAAWARWAGLL
jgi:predicted dehydrogenase/nucleoside-diphosphate-sugar epimerase